MCARHARHTGQLKPNCPHWYSIQFDSIGSISLNLIIYTMSPIFKVTIQLPKLGENRKRKRMGRGSYDQLNYWVDNDWIVSRELIIPSFFLFISFFIRWRINYWNQNINKCGNESTCIEWIWRLYTVYIRRPFYKCYNAISSIIIVFVKTLLNYFYPFSELLWVHSKNDSDRRTCGTCRHFAGVTLLPHWPIASFIHGLMRSMQWKTFTDPFSDDRNKCGGLLSLIMEQ